MKEESLCMHGLILIGLLHLQAIHLSPNIPLHVFPTFLVNNKLYFDSGITKVRQFIIDGVKEIIENYDVDGIHYDDYFYPEGEIPDDDTFLPTAPDSRISTIGEEII